MEKSSNTDRGPERPSPDDLYAFLPWACAQMQLHKDVTINKTYQNEYVSAVASERSKVKAGKSKARLASAADMADLDKDDASAKSHDLSDVVRINGVYDYSENLVGLKFEKNASIPRALMQIIGLIVKFQMHLTSLTINQGLTKYVLHEIVDLIPNSKITELCFDNCFLSEGSYFTLLEKANNLRNLSLSRCRINDDVVALIASQLCHPKPGSTNLVILNLSSNRITDVGAESIREALKTNSRLTYLNLADNMLTDAGAARILNVLLEFPLTKNELTDMRNRHIVYLKNKQRIIMQLAADLRAAGRKQPYSARSPKGKEKGKGDKDVEPVLISPDKFIPINDTYYEKAQIQVENTLKPFKDPYSADNVISRDGLTYCLGNNTLQLLNLSYNSLTFPSVQKLLEVIIYQRDLDRKPRGLLNCRMDGNRLPLTCKEMVQIEDLLEYNLSGPAKRNQTAKKKGK